jgi:hypothetical protein
LLAVYPEAADGFGRILDACGKLCPALSHCDSLPVFIVVRQTPKARDMAPL